MTAKVHQIGERSIFLAALEQDCPERRNEYLATACGHDAALRERVEGLLRCHVEAASLFGKLAPERIVEELAIDQTVGSGSNAIELGGPGDDKIDFLTPSEKPDSLGRLGSYEVEEVVGRGGMGIVLRAFDEKLHRAVAIKVMTAPLATNEHARRRFIREGRAAAAVRDDHVIGIHGVDETNGLPMLVMEYVVGRSLGQRLEVEGPLPVPDILRIGSQIARGLAAAHAQGLVHRDIKPANILLENGVERVKITDFGLAHAVDDVRTTQPGTVIGTPEYMSPEQARGEKVDYRSDLFSLGCVLYAMCAGRPPFRAESTVAIIRRVCDDTPRPLSEINPDIPGWLVDLIDKLIAKDASQRFQSATELAKLLGQYLAYVQQPAVNPQPVGWGKLAQPAPVHQRGAGVWPATITLRRWSIAAAILLLLSAGIGMAESTGITNVAATVIRIVRGDGTLVVEVGDPSIKVSVDGEELVITGAGPQEFRLRPGQHELHAVKDGKAVETKLVTITRDGREVVKVAREAPPAAAPAGPNNRQVWANGASLDAVPSPDGKYLCYVDWESGDVAVREMATGKHRRLLNQGHPELAVSAIFSPDSKQIAYSWLNKDKAYELRIIGLDGTGLRVLYSPNERNDKGRNYLEVKDWSKDGKYILASSSIGSAKGPQIVLVSTVDGSVRVLKTQYTWFEKPRLSPDGRYVAYSVAPQKSSRKRDIFLLATDGSGEAPLVEHPADDFVLGWSSDGKRVVFASDRTGSVGIWLIAVAEGKPQEAAELAKPEMGQFEPMGLTTSGSFYYGLYSGGQNIYTATLDPATGKILTPPAVAIQRGEGSNWAPAWSPDGRYLACLSSPQVRGPVFFIRSAESEEVRDLVPNLGKGFNVHSLHWSPDGRALLGTGTNEEGSWGAQSIDIETGSVTTLVPGEGRGLFSPHWAANGKAIFFTCTGNDARRLFRLDLETSVEQELYQTPARWAAKWWTLSPDGQQFAFSVGGTLIVLPATGGEPRELTKGEQPISTVAWTPDGRYLLFGKRGDKGGAELWRVPVTGGEPQKTGLAVATDFGHLRVHPDGRQIAFTSHGTQRDKSEVWVLENFLPPLADSKPPAAADASAATIK